MTEFERLESKIDAISSNKEIRIAIIAAVSSIIIAYFVKEESSKQTTVEIYKQFTISMIEGRKEEACRAVVIMATIEPIMEVEFSEALFGYMGCESEKSDNSMQGNSRKCRNTRLTGITRDNLGRIGRKRESEAESICKENIEIPDKIKGPFPDGTVSFSSGNKVSGIDIWCNYLPESKGCSLW
uniref:Uncharacterized protein n=1 Tax=Candidatus Kentrum sp. TC TaxID=2126339 RepID=A0A450YLH9_9GAMM|nr:MAG: hypothetical protein BECKTC1821D_GA0114238_101227 [Candidatus Kentron sp. TC]